VLCKQGPCQRTAGGDTLPAYCLGNKAGLCKESPLNDKGRSLKQTRRRQQGRKAMLVFDKKKAAP